jgi:hypothetical protein
MPMRLNVISFLLLVGSLINIIGCASSSTKDSALNRTVIDSATQLKGAPQWVSSTKSSWNSSEGVELKGTYSVKGNERIFNGASLIMLEVR